MLKFTMHAKELKTMIEKGVSAVCKKSGIPAFTRLYFQIAEDGTLKIWGTDLEHYAEIRSNNVWNASQGVLGIDINDLNIITKMNGDVTLDDISTETEQRLNIVCGNKRVTIPKYENNDVFLPAMSDTEECILTVKESWLLETVVNLSVCTNYDESSKIMTQVFNFNTRNRRVESMSNYMLGTRVLENQDIVEYDNLILHNKCVPVFKKILDKKSPEKISLSQDDKYVKIDGKNFTYIIRRIEGDYFNAERILARSKQSEYSFTANRESLLTVMKYNCDLLKGEKRSKFMPVVLHNENGKLYAYLRTTKYKTLDIVETRENNMKEDFYIGFNPQYLIDVFSIVDTDNPICEGGNSISSLFVHGNEYNFIVQPVRLEKEPESMKRSIDKSRMA